jgi:hypothetical protein
MVPTGWRFARTRWHRRGMTGCWAASKPGWADMPPQDLTPASGRQDHTILPSATTSLVRVLVIAHRSFDLPCDPIARKTLPRPSHPAPYVRDDHDTPLSRAGMGKVLEMIWGVRKQKYFCEWDWTGGIRLIRFNKFGRARSFEIWSCAAHEATATDRGVRVTEFCATKRQMSGSARRFRPLVASLLNFGLVFIYGLTSPPLL